MTTFADLYHPALGNVHISVPNDPTVLSLYESHGWVLSGGGGPDPTPIDLTVGLGDLRYAKLGDIPIKVQKYGAVGDGTTNDAAALAAAYAATGDLVVFESGKTYKVTGTLTVTKDTNLNGATLVVSGDVIYGANDVEIYDGAITVTGGILANGRTRPTLRTVTVTSTDNTGGVGVQFTQCTQAIADNNTISGGFRGITFVRCDDFRAWRNRLTNMPTNGAAGILVTSATGEVHGNGSLVGNHITDCYFGIYLSGGEADSTQPAYTGQITLQDIFIGLNTVEVLAAPQTLVGCIWATCSQRLNIWHNTVRGGRDVGIDFERCQQSQAVGNIVTDIQFGGLSAIHGSADILFEGNVVAFNRTLAGTASTSGVVWGNTSNWVGILRDNPTRVTFRGNSFVSANGTLSRFSLGEASQGLVIESNRFHNCYISGFSNTVGAHADQTIARNRFGFDINIHEPVIYNEKVLRWHCIGNTLRLADGESLNDDTRKYITVYDGGGNSDFVYICDNTVDDRIAQGIVISSPSTTMRAWITGNRSDRIATFWNGGGGLGTGVTYDRNYKLSTPGFTKMTTHDPSALNVTVPTLS